MKISKLYLLMALTLCAPAMATDLVLTSWAPSLNAEAMAC